MTDSAPRISIQGDPDDASPPPPRTRATMVLESRLRSLALAALSLAASGFSTACITEPTDELGAEGDPEAAEDLEAARSDDVVYLMGGSPAAVTAPVTLYQGSYYALGNQTLGPGIHDMDVLVGGIGNDTASSLRVPPGMTVKLYEHRRYGGRTWTAKADVASLTGFHDVTSSVAVYGPISEPAGSPHALGGFPDVESLKYKIASNPTLIWNLAHFAHDLGFANCNGTQSLEVGRHFDVFKDQEGAYVLNAHYDPDDPYADGEWAYKRLKIRLKNFRITVDPSTFTYGAPVQTELTPILLDQGFATNASQTPSTISVALNSSHEETYSHETSVSLTQGISVGITTSASIPFLGEAQASTEFSFSASQGWSNSSTTADVVGTEWTYAAQVSPLSKKLITLLAARSKSDVSYTARAHVSFEIELNGWLRPWGNAHEDHPTNKPYLTLTFGGGGVSGFDHILDLYDHAHIPNYSDWDWDWFKAFGNARPGSPPIGSLMGYFRQGITVPLSGEFSGVLGTTVFFTEGAEQPL